MQALERNFTDRVRSQVDNAVTTVKTRVMTHFGCFGYFRDTIARVELAIKSVKASSGSDPWNFVLDPDRKKCLWSAEGFQMTTLCELKSNILNMGRI